MYYVVRDSEKSPPSIVSEDNYYSWYNPMKKDHQIEFKGSINECYDYLQEHYPKRQNRK
ncbi:hypothetical protein SAMN05444392_10841 [Seinonella peptonophila]|uniref:Uncharacterized protein n=1 Tax=Seinonella peptonophila TaxID=112248 RepID=A0A1M4Z550_9BACL|nr:hypothetical protein SAMN05444392_10841 [Seinonella peptonophila]